MIAAHRRFRSKPQRALVAVKITEMANQIIVGGDENYLIFFLLKYGHFEREM